MNKILVIAMCLFIVSCSGDKQEPVTKSGLTKDQVMKMAEDNLKGEVSDSQLNENGITVTKVEGEDAREMLIKEMEQLEEEENNSK